MYRRFIFRLLAGLTATVVLALGALAVLISHDAPCPAVPPQAQDGAGFSAIMQRCYGSPDVLTLETLPRPELADDQVLVRVHAASVNPLEKHHLYGTPYLLRLVNGFNSPKSPRTGADLAGVVEAVGAEVTRFKPGDEVFGVGEGAFGEYVVRRAEGGLVLKPANVSFEQAAAMPVAAITALQALRDKAQLQPGQHVLINGASGGVGSYAVQLAKAMGATVTGVCSDRNVEMVRALGADHVIDYRQADYTEGDTRYDAIIDMVGNHSLSAMLGVTEPDGVLVLVGSMQMNPWWGPLAQPLYAMLRSPFVSQRLESLLASINADDLAELGRYAEAGQLTSVIDRRFPLAAVADAMRYQEQGRTRGKVIINVLPLPAAQIPQRAETAALPGRLLQDVSPSTDHHKHLMGPAIARAASGAPLADAIAVPAEFGGLLARREKAWNDPRELSKLYLPDSALLAESRRGWLLGHEEITGYLAQRFGSAYSMTPIHFLRKGDAAQMSGYYTRGAPPTQQHLGYFHLSLVRDDDDWIIASEIPRFPIAQVEQIRTAEELVAEMDRAGVMRSVVLSEAFWADGPLIPLEDPYPVVMEENDWTAAQVQSFPDRLIAFCSCNPVADHALLELDRCAANPIFRGLKFSFGMSGVNLNNEDHVARLRSVFARANQHRLPIVVHLRAGPEYGAEQVRIFLQRIVSVAPDIIIQVPHLWGGEAYSRSALAAFADAIEAGEQSTNLYFDLSEITAEISQTSSVESQQEVAALIRRIGIPRMLFGSDGQDAHRSWRSLVGFIPLHEEEFRTIAGNVAPYLR